MRARKIWSLTEVSFGSYTAIDTGYLRLQYHVSPTAPDPFGHDDLGTEASCIIQLVACKFDRRRRSKPVVFYDFRFLMPCRLVHLLTKRLGD
jgi:hypothetical protein